MFLPRHAPPVRLRSVLVIGSVIQELLSAHHVQEQTPPRGHLVQAGLKGHGSLLQF